MKFKNFVDESLLAEVWAAKPSISLSTALRWLEILGYKYQTHNQDVYFDGHEREDVVNYRKVFLEKMAEFEKFMAIYEGDLMERKPPVLSEGEKEHILVTHDESIFYSNDGSR
jgi:hypothetical protein